MKSFFSTGSAVILFTAMLSGLGCKKSEDGPALVSVSLLIIPVLIMTKSIGLTKTGDLLF